MCAEFRNPVGVITKALLVQRDIDVPQELVRNAWVTVFLSIPFADDAIGRAVEPQAPLVSRRFEAMRRLAESGIPTGVSVAPLIPGLNDQDIPRILDRARDCGARFAQRVLLRLPGSVRSVFLECLRQALPDRAARVERRIREVRGGKLNESSFFERQRGHGVYWDMIERQWKLHVRRLGFESMRSGGGPGKPTTLRRPSPEQGHLF